MAPKFVNLYVLLRITFSLFDVFNYKMEQKFFGIFGYFLSHCSMVLLFKNLYNAFHHTCSVTK